MAQSSVWIALLLSVAVIYSDVYARRVPNKALILALCLGTAFYIKASMAGLPVWPTAMAGLLTGLLALLPFYLIGWMGAGDVKYFATLGFLLGASALFPVWLVSALLLGVHSLIVIAQRSAMPLILFGGAGMRRHCHRWLQNMSLQRIRTGMRSARQGRTGAPYAAYLGVGALALMLGGMLDV